MIQVSDTPSTVAEPSSSNGDGRGEAGAEDARVVVRVGKKAAGRALDGQLWEQFPTNNAATVTETVTDGGEVLFG